MDLRWAVFVSSATEPAARCVVCASDISAGEGLTVHWQGGTLRFRCLGCLARFESDPQRYLDEHATDCCQMDDAVYSPMSEWAT